MRECQSERQSAFTSPEESSWIKCGSTQESPIPRLRKRFTLGNSSPSLGEFAGSKSTPSQFPWFQNPPYFVD
ncbi:hypothetical protein TNCV_3744781 [Trichonephila clavipes]|nr:hypothetical protein TNCV_3744781 [Trichonephila clavipes]